MNATNIVDKNVPVFMATERLSAAPVFAMPSGYAVRWFQPGDRATWVQVQQAAEKYATITPELFDKVYGTDVALLQMGIGFLVDGTGKAIGTCSAWSDDNFATRVMGRVHWVAIVPEAQGRGLAKPMLSATCQRLCELGFAGAQLETSTARIPAINLYRKFGFQPIIRNDEDRAIWHALAPHLKQTA
jgi:RimJ/RimL family protein N-acetyltransferase